MNQSNSEHKYITHFVLGNSKGITFYSRLVSISLQKRVL